MLYTYFFQSRNFLFLFIIFRDFAQASSGRTHFIGQQFLKIWDGNRAAPCNKYIFVKIFHGSLKSCCWFPFCYFTRMSPTEILYWAPLKMKCEEATVKYSFPKTQWLSYEFEYVWNVLGLYPAEVNFSFHPVPFKYHSRLIKIVRYFEWDIFQYFFHLFALRVQIPLIGWNV